MGFEGVLDVTRAIHYCERGGAEVKLPKFYFQELEFKEFARGPEPYKELCSRISPSIFGHEDVKKAIACLLFGGARKVCGTGVGVRRGGTEGQGGEGGIVSCTQVLPKNGTQMGSRTIG